METVVVGTVGDSIFDQDNSASSASNRDTGGCVGQCENQSQEIGACVRIFEQFLIADRVSKNGGCVDGEEISGMNVLIRGSSMRDALNTQSEKCLGLADDPLSMAIKEFRDGLADYNENAPDDDRAARRYAAVTYRPKRQVIERWATPAMTLRGAVDALRLASDAGEDDDHAVVQPMIKAALCYLENCR